MTRRNFVPLLIRESVKKLKETQLVKSSEATSSKLLVEMTNRDFP